MARMFNILRGIIMAGFETKDIRNIAILGHGGEGKTTLVEALLFAAGVTDRQGRVEDGTTVTDFDPEEIKRHISISAAVAPVEWKKKRLNIIDVPGYFDFIGEMVGPLRVAETAGILVNAVRRRRRGHGEGVAVRHQDTSVGKLLIINQMDREHADFDKVLRAAAREVRLERGADPAAHRQGRNLQGRRQRAGEQGVRLHGRKCPRRFRFPAAWRRASPPRWRRSPKPPQAPTTS